MDLRHPGLCICAGILLACVDMSVGAPLFEDTIAPILQDHCVKCHRAEKRKGELDLTSPAGIMNGGESGPVFTAGDIEYSHLFELVEKGEMPKKGEKLSHKQIDSIRAWIEAGAKFRNQPILTEVKMSEHDVLPIVLLRCTSCHGRQLQENGLDFRTVANMKQGGKSGPALVPGDPDASLMIQRIESEACPPKAKLLKYFVKRPSQSELKKLRSWIAEGAPIGNVQPDVATTKPDPLVSDEDRKHWAFQPPRKPESGDSIDFFIKQKLADVNLKFSPQADRDTLIRRAYIDLIGMPPPVEAWKKWRSDPNADWFAQMVDELLESPHYGERWGRYWLDVAGYADSEGGLSSDPIREVAWKYRDYVINAFNTDKPYDQFLLEQIAGDELVDYRKAPEVTDEIVENLTATGFLRMGIDQTGSRTMNYAEDRIGVVADAINVLGSGVMGLTMECVRCHSHKYDPIPHRDYYRLKAVLQGAMDEHDWLSFKTRTLNVATADHKKRVAQTNPPLDSKLKSLESLLRKKIIQWQREMLRSHYPDQSEKDRKATFPALRRADNQRSLPQRLLVEKLQISMTIPNADQPASVQQARAVVKDIETEMDETRSLLEPPLAIRALWDRGEPSPTYILRRGEHTSPGRWVGPGVPSALTDGQTPFEVAPPFPEASGRRLAFAQWLTQPDQPLTARVMVNRIWNHHFGSGIVKTMANFGVKGEAPSHPELLDWLAVEFIERGWSIKELHRVIMNSKTYKQSSRVPDDRLAVDPLNQLLSRMPLRRMDAEALRDSLLLISGTLDPTPGGRPDGVKVNREGFVNVKKTARGGWRRSIYIQYRRTEIPSMMDTFDYPEMGPNCVSRNVSTVSPQSLMLMNNDRVRDLAEAFAARIEKESGNDRGGMVDRVYHMAMSRSPSSTERKLGVETIVELEKAWGGDLSGALKSYCHTILNSAGFIYVD